MYLPITDYRPEEFRVAKTTDDAREVYIVRTRRPGGQWVNQKVHETRASAERDAFHWYHDAPSDGPSETTDAATRACRALVDAYEGDGEPGSGASIEWEALDHAYALAKKATTTQTA